jgi:hypothetical protein
MNISILAFVVWAGVISGFLFLIMNREAVDPLRGLTQRGDTSIGRYSFDWMGAIALIGAVVICCFVD